MKPKILIYEKVSPIIPNGSAKTVFFAFVTETSYEVFFYAFIDGKPVRCFELAEQEILDENELNTTFEAIVEIIKDSKVYIQDKNNVVTITVDKSGVKMGVEYYEKDTRMYRIKKEWEGDNIQL